VKTPILAPTPISLFFRLLFYRHNIATLRLHRLTLFRTLSGAFVQWLYFKNEHIVASCLLAHQKHPFGPTDRFLVVSISLMVAYGLNCIFSSTGNETLATILSMTVGVVVQSIFGAWCGGLPANKLLHSTL
jgi:hypothetical protein